ncbi:MAG: MBL fold metallo-hydrolase [Rhodocyclaceae bacterium]|nr:MBL fold metallo-hydrolase [Rhodocyclaceae bacterium]
MIRFTLLASGSKGNALLVEKGATRLVIDCGLPPRDLSRRLEARGVAPTSVRALLLTHEHADHVAGAARAAAHFGWTLHASFGTASAAASVLDGVPVQRFDSHTPFAIGELSIQPYPVPHDAREPTQFVFADGAVRLGLVTDAGAVTPHMVKMLSGCAALILECNHDAEMLWRGRYPYPLKKRISGGFGHLSNDAAAQLLAAVAHARLQHVIAAHLSQENNRPELAQQALAEALGCPPSWIDVASQEGGLDWREIR